jgi:hypothetical protein
VSARSPAAALAHTPTTTIAAPTQTTARIARAISSIGCRGRSSSGPLVPDIGVWRLILEHVGTNLILVPPTAKGPAIADRHLAYVHLIDG